MSDSTNVDRPGSCPSESEVIPKLTQLIREAPQAIILGCFASSLHRIQNVLNIAAACGRVVFAAGLNMERNIRIAAEHGYLELPGDLRDDLRSVESVPRQKRLILTTGSQGEPLAGLSRMAMGTHKFVQVQPGDRVILSTRLIPGNERSIYSMINNFARRGADVYDERSTPGIHVSGHAYRDDLRHLINLTTPQYLVPVHGEYRHLEAHRRLGISLGMESQEVFRLEDGDVLELTASSAEVVGKVQHGRIYVDGKGVGDVGEVVLRDRKYLGEDGMVVVALVINHETGEVLSGPDIFSRGFVYEGESAALLDEAKRLVSDALAATAAEEREDLKTAEATVKKELRRFFKQRTERYPMILPVIMEV